MIDNSNLRRIFGLLIALMGVVLVLASNDYGISWDEERQQGYGESVVRFYASLGSDTSYINEDTLIHYYGGLVETLAALAVRSVKGDRYEVRHSILSLFGLVLILFTGLAARLAGGWKAAILALLFTFFTPVIFANAVYNSKDIPFAATYIMALYFIMRYVREFPTSPRRLSALLVLSVGSSIGIRVGGLLLVAYLFLFLLIKVIRQPWLRQGFDRERVRVYAKGFLQTVGLSAAAYLLGLVFWPYALTNPFLHPFEALTLMAKYDAFDSYNLFNGRWIHRWEVPWSYIPVWILITTPLFITASLLLVPLAFIRRPRASSEIRKKPLALLCFAALFPIVFVIVNKSNVYDGWRHLYFAFPPLASATAVAWSSLLESSRRSLRLCSALVLALFIAEPARWMAANHPLDSFYFSPLIGGSKGAFGRFEIDYYGTSLRHAVEWIAKAHRDEGGREPARVRCYYGEQLSTKHFVDKHDNLRYVTAREDSLDWDYSIVLGTQAKWDHQLLANWPPKGTVHEIKAGGAPVSAIVKNFRTTETTDLAAQVRTQNTAHALIDVSLELYKRSDFLGSLKASAKALLLEPGNAIALNNLSTSFFNLGLHAEAAQAARAALATAPDFHLAKNNLGLALRALEAQRPKEPLARNYLNVSLVYYELAQYQQCIEFANASLRHEPVNAAAHNNICAAYNALGQHQHAEAACNRSLEVDPNFELARNNLAVARGHLD